jgi:hypothetical protein
LGLERITPIEKIVVVLRRHFNKNLHSLKLCLSYEITRDVT